MTEPYSVGYWLMFVGYWLMFGALCTIFTWFLWRLICMAFDQHMLTSPPIRTGFAWRPMRLARHVPDPERPGTTRMEFIGWIWWQTVVMTNNLNHGWVVFLDSTPLKPRCRKCGQELPSA